MVGCALAGLFVGQLLNLSGSDRTEPCAQPATAAAARNLGQIIDSQTGFCAALAETASSPRVTRVLEIGTWYGGGSSLCIAKALKARGGDRMLYTMEIFEEAWDNARKLLKEYPVRCILGGTVPVDKYLKPHEIPDEEKGEHYKLYYERDIALAKVYEPMLEVLCKNHEFQMVLIDGNEYTAYAEYEIVRDVCRPHFIALHDVGTLKTRRIDAEMSASPTWKQIASGKDSAQWKIYERRIPL
eukprot:a841170_55.p1 GENE.a841170_55~~a841170_55.p1  ORF type:complete len:260 (+),score=83.12 a841170_55:57-782(+)